MPERIDPNDPTTWPATARDYLARREPPAEERAARSELAAWVAAQGRVTWAALMERALYAPGSGYYRSGTEPIGTSGDFVTSPELHPAFGACVARWLRERWEELGQPDSFRIVEAGGGSGAAAAQILETAQAWPRFVAAIDYVLLEPGENAERRQRARFRAGPSPRWVHSWRLLPPSTGVIWVNELLDALPVHRVVRIGGTLRECWVGCCGEGRLEEETGPLSTPALDAYFADLGFHPPEGATVEVNLAAGEWLRAAAARLERGFLLLFDYGGDAESLYGDPRRAGTLRAYRRHTLIADPLAAVGTADLTADVEFTTLMRVAGEAGLRTRAFTDQARFLRKQGIGDWLARPPAADTPGHLRLVELLDPAGLGRVRVLELERGAGEPGEGDQSNSREHD